MTISRARAHTPSLYCNVRAALPRCQSSLPDENTFLHYSNIVRALSGIIKIWISSPTARYLSPRRATRSLSLETRIVLDEFYVRFGWIARKRVNGGGGGPNLFPRGRSIFVRRTIERPEKYLPLLTHLTDRGRVRTTMHDDRMANAREMGGSVSENRIRKCKYELLKKINRFHLRVCNVLLMSYSHRDDENIQ